MNRKPLLIFNNYLTRPTDGGPSGFLAQNLLGVSSPHFDLGKCHGAPPSSRWQRLRQGYFGYNAARTLAKIGLRPDSYFGPWMLSARHTFHREQVREYPFIWFHDVWALAACRDMIQPHQKIILQCHCPELPSEETASQNIQEPDVRWTQFAEKTAFERADICVFPNAGAQGIYKSLLKPDAQVEYLLSGSHELKPRVELPFDPRFVYFLYIGRRNAIKGFDIILQAFEQAHRQDASLRLLLVGGGEPVRSPGVIDLGRSEDPANWIAACDYFISANRQSYFDLSVMEALSIGTPMIIACTGGHDYYAALASPGIAPIPEAKAGPLAEALLQNRKKRAENSLAVSANKKIHREELSVESYRARLEKLLEKVLNGRDGN